MSRLWIGYRALRRTRGLCHGGIGRRWRWEVSVVAGERIHEAAALAQLLLELPASGGAGLLQLLQGDGVGGELGGDRATQVLVVVVVNAQLGGVARVVPDCDGLADVGGEHG